MSKQCVPVMFLVVLISSSAWSQTPPQITMTTPGPNAIGVTAVTNVSVSFSTTMDVGTMNSSTIVVYGSMTGYHPGQFSYNKFIRILTFNPDVNFAAGEIITVSITTGVESTLGIPLAVNHAFNFTAGAEAGSGVFKAAEQFTESNAKPWGLCAVDFDGDSHIDLVTRKYTTENPGITIWSNDGVGAFAGDNCSTNDEMDSFDNFKPVDVDRDSDFDIMVEFSDWSDGDMEYALIENPFSAVISPQTCIVRAGLASNFELADFDGDGFQDLIDTYYWGEPPGLSVYVFTNSGTGYFSASWWETVTVLPKEVCTGDFNNDGSIDFATLSDEDVYVTVWLNDGEASFTQSSQHWPGQDPYKIYSADLDGDSFVDIITANRESDTISVMLNSGSGGFINRTVYAAGDEPKSLVAADFDGDGDHDLAIANFGSLDVSVLMNNGEGDFSGPRMDYPCGSENGPPGTIVAADFDGDGGIDLATSNGGYFSSAISIFLNQESLVDVPDPVYLPSTISLSSNFPNPFNPQTLIAFDLSKEMKVTLRVYDVNGRLVKVLVDGEESGQGRNEATWNGRDDDGKQVAAGVYFYRLDAGEFAETKRMALVK